MLRVDFYELDWDTLKYGIMASLTWDGARFRGKCKDHPHFLRNILASGIVHSPVDGATSSNATDHPERFMRNLHLHYRSPRIYASKAYDPGAKK